MGKRAARTPAYNKKGKKSKKSQVRKTVVVRDINEQEKIGLTLASIGRTMFPKSITRKIRYQENILTLNPGAGGICGYYLMAANAVYDPYLGVGGHQPMGLDSMFNYYNACVVKSSLITCRFTSSDGTYNNMVGIHLAPANITTVDAIRFVENGNGVFDVCTNTAVSEGNQVTLSMKFDHYKYFGTKLDKGDVNWQSTASANITNPNLAAFVVWCAPFQAVDTGGCSVVMTIDYWCEFVSPSFEQAIN